MSIRVSIVSTRTGDDGTTSLGDKTRVAKDAARIVALGEVDELNSAIGLWRTHPLPPDTDALLDQIQQDLFDLRLIGFDVRRFCGEVEINADIAIQRFPQELAGNAYRIIQADDTERNGIFA